MEALSGEVMAAARRGARSVTRGWMREEAESAALESLVRRPCTDVRTAYIQGKRAAIDELRVLTGHRSAYWKGRAAWPTGLDGEPVEFGVDEPGYERVESALMVEDRTRWVRHARTMVIVRMIGEGYTGVEIAEWLGVHPSRVSQHLHKARPLLRRSA